MNNQDILRLLPEVFRQAHHPNTPMDALLDVMAGLFTPIEDVLDGFSDNLRADRADPDFVYFLARFMDLDRFFVSNPAGSGAATRAFAAGLPRLRALIRAAPELSRLRGTRDGLCRFLATATGIDGFDLQEAPDGPDGRPVRFHINVTAPIAARPFETLILRIIEAEKPAYVTFSLNFEGLGDA